MFKVGRRGFGWGQRALHTLSSLVKKRTAICHRQTCGSSIFVSVGL